MRPLQLSELVQPLQAQLLGPDARVRSVSTDSRDVGEAALFVALRGEQFDGHDYLQQACESGAVAALVDRPVDVDMSLLRVQDTQRALGYLGACNRQLYRGPLVAITGSNGKTTAKNLCAAVLGQRGVTLATDGNFNNEIGVPLTLLRLAPEHEFAVVEMGAAAAGDIRWLCELGQPQVAVLLNAMPAHLQGFGSVDDVAAAKGEIFDGLGAQDSAVINADQPWAGDWRERAAPAQILDFGLQAPAAVSARDIEVLGVQGSRFTAVTPAGELAMRVHLPGRHNIYNALAATCVGLACGLDLKDIGRGIASVEPAPGRLAIRAAARGATLLDDCYNANPGSVRAALDLLSQCAPRRTAILGAMRELGPDSERLHREVGAYARELGIERLWGVGEELLPALQAFGEGGRHFGAREDLLPLLQREVGDGDTVLVKGSRSAGMEQVSQALLAPNGREAD